MSRYFGVSQYLSATNQTVPFLGTMSYWVYPTQAQSASLDRMLLNWYWAGSWEFGIWQWSGGTLYNGFYNGGERRVIISNANYSLPQNQWSLFVFTWDGGARTFEVFLNNTSLGSRSDVDPIAGSATLGVGNSAPNPMYHSYTRGQHLCLWGRVLDANERTALYRGVHPLRISSKIVADWEITGKFDPEPDLTNRQSSLTLNGSPAYAERAPVEAASLGSFWSAANSISDLARIEQFIPQVIQGADTPPLQVEQYVLQVISEYNGYEAVSQLTVEPVYGQTAATARVGQLIIEVVRSPYNRWSYSEIGAIVLDGITTAHFVPKPPLTEWHYAEVGNLVIAGLVSGHAELHRGEIGSLIIDGETVAVPIIDVNVVVTQSVAEILAVPNPSLQVTQSVAETLAVPAPSLQVTQSVAEALAQANSSLLVTQVVTEALRRDETELMVEQVVAEVLVAGWRSPDFMPALQQFMG
jgi:hypothetical protein